MSMYDTLARSILENIGGAANINSVTHCVTRLRVVVKDDSKVRVDALNATEGVAGTLKSYGQYMIIIGTTVPDVYDAFCRAAHIDAEKRTPQEEPAKQNLVNRLIGIMTDVFAPFLGVIASCGVLKGLLPLLSALGLMDPAGSTYHILYSLADGFFYYMPILLAYTASKRFGLPVPEGLAIGAGMLYPNLLASSSAVHDSLFGIPVIMPPGGDYTSSAVPIIAAVAFAAWLEKKYKKYIPDALKPFGVPLITCSVSFALTIWVIGPITSGVTALLAFVLHWLESLSHILFSGFLGVIWQFVLMVGLHWAVLPLVIANLASPGYDTTLSSTFGCNFAQIGTVLAVRAKTKDPELRKRCLPAILSASVGVIEPALYGVTLKQKKLFVITSVVSGIVGVGMVLSGARAYRLAGFGVFGYAAYTDPDMGIRGVLWAVFWSVVALVLSFVVVWFTYKEPEQEKTPAAADGQEHTVSSPLDGSVLDIRKMSDPVFASETLGKGCAIEPSDDTVTAPFDGTVDMVADTKHAVGLTSTDGVQLLIHVGVDTVGLNGQGFEPKVVPGQKVKCGELLLRFDPSVIKAAGLPLTTAVVVLNSDEYADIAAPEDASTVTHGQKLLDIR